MMIKIKKITPKYVFAKGRNRCRCCMPKDYSKDVLNKVRIKEVNRIMTEDERPDIQHRTGITSMTFKVKCSCGARDKEKCHKESSSGYGKLCCKPKESVS